jgi:Flp pilus assembly CpaE family ATPase
MMAPALADLLLEVTRRSDLRALTESAASDAESLSAAAAVVADGSLQAIVRAASTAPELARLLLEISRRADLRKLAEAASANVALADAFSDLAGAEENLMRSMAGIIGKANRMATDGQTSSLVTEAVSAALGDPEATAKTAAIRLAGGVRARILTWLLNVS